MKLVRILMTVAVLAFGAFGCGGGDEAAEEPITDESAQGGEETAPMDEPAPATDAPAEGTEPAPAEGTEPAPEGGATP